MSDGIMLQQRGTEEASFKFQMHGHIILFQPHDKVTQNVISRPYQQGADKAHVAVSTHKYSESNIMYIL